MSRLARRIRLLLRRDRLEAEMTEEMRFHLEMEVEENLRRGMSPAEARRKALTDFGGVERYKEQARDARGGRPLDDLAQDLRLTLRKLARAPGFTLVILLTLALGIGANTAIFTLVDSILLRRLPYPSPERLVRVYQTAPERGVFRGSLSLPDGRDLGERSTLLEALGLFSTLPSGLVFTGGEQARELRTAYVSGGFFPTLGSPALLGRALLPGEEEGDNRVLVLSHGFWLREMGGDPEVVGQSLDMEGRVFRVVGVMPPDFSFPQPDVEVWTFLTVIPPSSIPLHLRPVRILDAVARLSPSASLPEAQAELSALSQGLLEESAPGVPEVVGAALVPLRETIVGDARLALFSLLGAVGLILVLACANVANLLLARGVGRSTEMALRAALGAQRSRLVRQLLTESVLLALMGGLLGLALAKGSVDLFLARSAGLLPRTWEVGIRWEVLLFALLLSLLTGLIFGMLPAVTGADTDPAGGLRDGMNRGSTAQGHSRLRRGLVVAQVSLALVLLVGAGLMVRSLSTLRSVDPGFRAQGLLGVTVAISDVLYPEPEEFMGAYRALLERYRNLPGVTDAASIRYLPMRGTGEQGRYTVVGRPPPREGQEPSAWTLQVSSSLFRVLGVPLLAGRAFTAEDRIGSPRVAVVNETLAREAFGFDEPVGRSLFFWGEEVRIVGVVGDVRQQTLREPPLPTIYLHQEQVPRRAMTFLLRTDGDPLALAEAARGVIEELNPDQPVSAIVDVTEVVEGSAARSAFLTLLLAAFALLAFILSALGVYGVVSYLVARQMHEMGIRLALGARPREVVGLIFRRGMGPVVLGLAIGLALALFLSRFIQDLLYFVAPSDPATYLAGLALLSIAAALATLLPTWRVLRTNPENLLKRE